MYVWAWLYKITIEYILFNLFSFSSRKTMFIPRNLAFDKFFKGNALGVTTLEKLLALPKTVLGDFVKQHVRK